MLSPSLSCSNRSIPSLGTGIGLGCGGGSTVEGFFSTTGMMGLGSGGTDSGVGGFFSTTGMTGFGCTVADFFSTLGTMGLEFSKDRKFKKSSELFDPIVQ